LAGWEVFSVESISRDILFLLIEELSVYKPNAFKYISNGEPFTSDQ
jgi:hypothetical protein